VNQEAPFIDDDKYSDTSESMFETMHNGASLDASCTASNMDDAIIGMPLRDAPRPVRSRHPPVYLKDYVRH